MGAIKAGAISVPQIQVETTPLRQFVFGPRPQRTLCRVLVWCVLTVAFFHNLLVPIQVIGYSMTPTYRNGSLNLVNRWSYTQKHRPRRGDVVALSADGELLLKRIVGLPGETVAIEGGALVINGKPLTDQFSKNIIPWELDAVHLGQDEYFVIGDNRAATVFCKVPKHDILGKVVF